MLAQPTQRITALLASLLMIVWRKVKTLQCLSDPLLTRFTVLSLCGASQTTITTPLARKISKTVWRVILVLTRKTFTPALARVWLSPATHCQKRRTIMHKIVTLCGNTLQRVLSSKCYVVFRRGFPYIFYFSFLSYRE